MALTDILVGLSIVLEIILLVLMLTGALVKNVRDLMREQTAVVQQGQERLEKLLRDELALARQESAQASQRLNEALDRGLQALTTRVTAEMLQGATHQKERLESMQDLMYQQGKQQAGLLKDMSDQQKNSLDSFMQQTHELTRMNAQKLDAIQNTVATQLAALQKDNSEKLEQMRNTVDEKLHQTLEQRLGEAFKQVSERLELVQKGLGEMHTLASGVGDLKKVLTNVKTRGTLGEVQLDAILEQVLTRDQYEEKAIVKRGSAERVDFAVRLPGREDPDEVVLLPIDAKFPLEDYQRLVEAQEAGDAAAAVEAAKQLETRIRMEAKSIRDKYLNPPKTTDFALMFLPIEGLVAEVFRRPGLWESIQREYQVVITGPTNITALLNALQMGFRTLAIQKRSSEVWQLLGVVKTEFGKFGDILERTKKKLEEATHTIDSAASKSRNIERKLRTVEALPVPEGNPVLEALDVGVGE